MYFESNFSDIHRRILYKRIYIYDIRMYNIYGDTKSITKQFSSYNI